MALLKTCNYHAEMTEIMTLAKLLAIDDRVFRLVFFTLWPTCVACEHTKNLRNELTSQNITVEIELGKIDAKGSVADAQLFGHAFRHNRSDGGGYRPSDDAESSSEQPAGTGLVADVQCQLGKVKDGEALTEKEFMDMLRVTAESALTLQAGELQKCTDAQWVQTLVKALNHLERVSGGDRQQKGGPSGTAARLAELKKLLALVRAKHAAGHYKDGVQAHSSPHSTAGRVAGGMPALKEKDFMDKLRVTVESD